MNPRPLGHFSLRNYSQKLVYDILFAYFVVETKSKNYMQSHKMDYMLLVSVIKSIFDKSSKYLY